MKLFTQSAPGSRCRFPARAGMVRTVAAGCVTSLAAVSILFAPPLPESGSFRAGSGSIETAGQSLNVTTTVDRSIIDWDSFSIDAGHGVDFAQPGSGSAVLNRVNGGSATEIFGTLTSNGSVFLLNPNGVLVGASGVIDTAGFTASTLDLADSAFLAGADLSFTGASDAKVINLGSITASAGDIFLIARQVENAGSLSAPTGTVGLASGTEVLLAASGAERIFVLAGDGADGETGIDHSGSIAAVSAELKAKGNLYSLAINSTGTIAATGISEEGGRIVLKATGADTEVSGSLDASGSVGGDIQVLGDRVILNQTAELDASGDTGGGEILIGGDFQGNNPEVPNARRTLIRRGATITADAITEGSGGRVIVWADEITGFAGVISATGGSESGNGGSVEVSGKQSLAFSGQVDLRAAKGLVGDLLLDPDVINIIDAATPSGDDSEITADQVINAPDGGAVTFTISDAALEAAIDTANTSIAANQSINFQTGVVVNATATTNSLTVTAGTDITFTNADITTNGDITMTATNAISMDSTSSLDSGTGDISLEGTNSTVSLADVNTGGSFTVNAGGLIVQNSGSVNVGTSASLTSTSQVRFRDFDVNTNLTVNAALAITQLSDEVTVGGTSDFTAGGGIAMTQANDFGGVVTIGGGTTVSVTDTNALSLGDSMVSTSLTVDSGGVLTLTADPSIAGSLELTASGGITTASNITANGITLNNDVDLTAAVAQTIDAGGGGLDFGGQTLTKTMVGDLVLNGGFATFGAVSFSAAGQLTDNIPASNRFAGTYAGVVNLGAASLVGNASFNGGITLNGPFVMAGFDATFGSAATVTGNATITTGNGTLTVNSPINDNAGDFDLEFAISGAGGRVDLDAEIGITDPIGTLTVSGSGPFDLTQNIVVGALTTTTTGNLFLAATIEVDGNTTNISSPVVLTANTVINDIADINFLAGGTIDGDGLGPWTLTLNADTDGDGDGDVTFADAVGGTANDPAAIAFGVEVDSVAINTTTFEVDNAQTFPNVPLTFGAATSMTSGAAIVFGGTVDLQSSGTVSITSGGAAGEDITFNNTIDDTGSDDTLLLNAGAGGDVNATAAIGGTSDLAAFTVTNAAQVDLNTVETTGNISVTGTNTDLNAATYTSGGGDVAFVGNVDNDAGGLVTITSGGAAGQDISITGALDMGGQAVTFNAGAAGDITVTGAVSNGGNLTVTDGNVIDFQSTVNAADLNVLDASTSLSFGGTVTTTGFADLDSAGTITTGAINATGLVDVNATGQVDLGNVSGTSITIAGSGIDLNGNSYVASTGATTLTGNVDLDAAAVTVEIDSGGGNNVSIDGTVNDAGGNSTLQINAGAGDVSITGAVGGTNPITGFDIEAAGVVDVNSIILNTADNGAIDMTGATTRVDLNGGTYTAGAAIDMSSAPVSLASGGLITVTSGGAAGENISFAAINDPGNNDGTTLNAGAAGNVSVGGDAGVGANDLASFTVSNAAQVDLNSVEVTGAISVDGTNIDLNGATYTAAGGSVAFNSNVDNDSNGLVTITSGGAAGQDITVGGILDMNTDNVTFDAGAAGDVTVTGNVIDGGDLTITDSALTSLQAVTVGTLAITDTTTSVTVNGAINATALTTGAANYDVSLLAGGTVTNDTTVNNTGTIRLGNAAADTITFTGGLDTTAGTTSAAGTINTTNTQMDIGAVTLTDTTTFDTGATGAVLNVGAVTGGSNALTLDAGATGAIGVASIAGVTTLTVTDGGSFAVTGTTGATDIDVNSIAGLTNFGGAITATNLAITTNTLTFGATSDVDVIAATVAAGPFDFTDSDGVTVGIFGGETGITTTNAAIDIDTTAGTITVDEAIASNGAGAGDISLTAGGAGQIDVNTGINASADDITLNAGGAMDLGGTVNGAVFDFDAGGAMTQSAGSLTAATSLTADAAGVITLNQAGNTAPTIDLTSTGTGANGAITADIDATDITLDVSAGGATGAIDFTTQTTNPVTAVTITQVGSGDVDFTTTQNIDVDITQISAQGGAVDVDLQGDGAVELLAGGITTAGGDITLTHSTGTATDLALITGNVTSGGGVIELSSPNGQLTIDGTVDSTPGAGGTLTLTGGPLINGTVTVGAGDITLTAGGSPDFVVPPAGLNFNSNTTLAPIRDIIVQGALTSTGGANLSLQADSDTDGDGGVLVTGAGSINSAGTLSISGNNYTDIGLSLGTNVGDAVALNGTGPIQSAGLLTINRTTVTNTNDIVIADDVTSSGGNVVIGSGNNVNQAILPSATITATGNTVTLNDDLDLQGATVLTGDTVTFAAGVDVTETGAQDFEITTTASDITQPAGTSIAVTGATTFNANAGAANITLVNAGNTFGDLTLTGNTINIDEDDAGGTVLDTTSAGGTFTLNSAGDITDIGTVSVTGATTITTTGDITLDDGANTFGTLTLNAVNATIVENAATDFDATNSTVSTSLNFSSAGAFTTNDTITVPTLAIATSGTGAAGVIGTNATPIVVDSQDVTATISAATATGDIFIDNVSAVAITDSTFTNLGNGNVDYDISGDINAAVTGATTDGGTIRIVHAPTTLTNTLTVNGLVDSGNAGNSNGGAINLESDGNLTIAGASSVTSAIGAGGNLVLNGGPTINGSVTVGAGTVTLRASGSPDLVIGAPINASSNITFQLDRDIIVNETVTAAGNITLTADNDNDGLGGVLIAQAGQLVANGTGIVNIRGSEFTNLGGTGGFGAFTAIPLAVAIEDDGANDQIDAQGNVTIAFRVAPDPDSDIEIGGDITTAGNITINSNNNNNNVIRLGADLVAGSGGAGSLTLQDRTDLIADSSITGDTLTLQGLVTDDGNGFDFAMTSDAPAASTRTFTQNITVADLTLDFQNAVTANFAASVISATSVALTGGGVTYNLNNNNNDLSVLAVDTTVASATVGNGANALEIGTAGVVVGAQPTTALTLSADGAVTQSQPIITPTLDLSGNGSFNLNSATNDVTTITASTAGFIRFRDADTLIIDGAASANAGVQFDVTTGSISITDQINVSSQQAVLNVENGDISLSGAGEITSIGLLIYGNGTADLTGGGGVAVATIAAARSNALPNNPFLGDLLVDEANSFSVGQVDDLDGQTINGINVDGDVDILVPAGTLDDNGLDPANVFTITGLLTIDADTASVVLDGNNNINELLITEAGNTTINDINGIVLVTDDGGGNDFDMLGNLTLTAGGAGTITDTQVTPGEFIALGGVNTFNSATGAITLDQLDAADEVRLTTAGADATVVDRNTLVLGASNVVGTLTATATLGEIQGAGIVGATAVDFTAVDGINNGALGPIQTATENIDATTSGANGEILITNTVANLDVNIGTINATNGGEIELTHNGGSGDILVDTLIDSGGADVTITGSNLVNMENTGGANTNSTPGGGGVLTIGSGVVNANTSSITLGAGNITITGSALASPDTIINADLSVAGDLVLSAVRDVIIRAEVQTIGGDLEIIADDDLTTQGGVLIEPGGHLDIDGELDITGAEFTNEGGGGSNGAFVGEFFIVEADDGSDATTLQIEATGQIAAEPNGTAIGAGLGDVRIEGDIISTGSDVEIDAFGGIGTGQIFLGATIEADTPGEINLFDDVVLVDNTSSTLRAPRVVLSNGVAVSSDPSANLENLTIENEESDLNLNSNPVEVSGVFTVIAEELAPATDRFIVTANNAGNAFGQLDVTGLDITVTESDGMDIVGVQASGNVILTAGGAVTDDAAADIDVAGTFVVDASGGINAVTLDQADSVYTGIVSLLSGGGAITLDVANLGIPLLTGDIQTSTTAAGTDAGDIFITAPDIQTEDGDILTSATNPSGAPTTGVITLQATDELIVGGNTTMTVTNANLDDRETIVLLGENGIDYQGGILDPATNLDANEPDIRLETLTTGDIVISDKLENAGFGNVRLNLISANDVILNSSIGATGAGNTFDVEIIAENDISTAVSVGTIESNGGPIDLLTNTGDIFVRALIASTGEVVKIRAANDYSQTNEAVVTTRNLTGDTPELYIISGNDLSVEAGATVGTRNTNGFDGGDIFLTAGNDIITTGSTTISSADLNTSQSGNIFLRSGGDIRPGTIDVRAVATNAGGDGYMELDATAGNILDPEDGSIVLAAATGGSAFLDEQNSFLFVDAGNDATVSGDFAAGEGDTADPAANFTGSDVLGIRIFAEINIIHEGPGGINGTTLNNTSAPIRFEARTGDVTLGTETFNTSGQENDFLVLAGDNIFVNARYIAVDSPLNLTLLSDYNGDDSLVADQANWGADDGTGGIDIFADIAVDGGDLIVRAGQVDENNATLSSITNPSPTATGSAPTGNDIRISGARLTSQQDSDATQGTMTLTAERDILVSSDIEQVDGIAGIIDAEDSTVTVEAGRDFNILNNGYIVVLFGDQGESGLIDVYAHRDVNIDGQNFDAADEDNFGGSVQIRESAADDIDTTVLLTAARHISVAKSFRSEADRHSNVTYTNPFTGADDDRDGFFTGASRVLDDQFMLVADVDGSGDGALLVGGDNSVVEPGVNGSLLTTQDEEIVFITDDNTVFGPGGGAYFQGHDVVIAASDTVDDITTTFDLNGAEGSLTVLATNLAPAITDSSITVRGGNADDADVIMEPTQFITMTAEGDDADILFSGGGIATAANGGITLNAGNGGDGSDALINHNDNLTLTANGLNATVTLQGGAGVNADLDIEDTNNLTINATGTNSTVTIQGGSETNADALLDVDNSFTINADGTSSDVIIQGGSATTAVVDITVDDNVDIQVGVDNQNDDGTFTFRGGTGLQADATITDTGGGSFFIRSDDMLFAGGSGTDADASITSSSTANYEVDDDVTITGGTGDDSTVQAGNVGGATNWDIEGDLTMTGGGNFPTTANADGILTGGGATTVNVAGNATLSGGAGSGSDATIDSGGALNFDVGGFLTLNGSDTASVDNSDAFILTGGGGAIDVVGDLTVRGGDAANLNSDASIDLTGGTSTLNAANIFVTGGSAAGGGTNNDGIITTTNGALNIAASDNPNGDIFFTNTTATNGAWLGEEDTGDIAGAGNVNVTAFDNINLANNIDVNGRDLVITPDSDGGVVGGLTLDTGGFPANPVTFSGSAGGSVTMTNNLTESAGGTNTALTYGFLFTGNASLTHTGSFSVDIAPASSLETGTVDISTGDDGTNDDDNNITSAVPINKNGAGTGTLIFNAADIIDIDADITANAGGLNINFDTTHNDIDIDASITSLTGDMFFDSVDGDFDLAASEVIESTTGDIRIGTDGNNDGVSSTQVIGGNTIPIDDSTANITINSNAIVRTSSGTIAMSSGETSGGVEGVLLIDTGATIEQAGTGPSSFFGNSYTTVTHQGTISSADTFNVNLISDANGTLLPGDLLIQGDILTSGGTVDLLANNHDMAEDNDVLITAGTIDSTDGDITITAEDDVEISGTAVIDSTADADIVITSGARAGGNVDGDFLIDGGTSFVRTVGGDITVDADGLIDIDGATISMDAVGGFIDMDAGTTATISETVRSNVANGGIELTAVSVDVNENGGLFAFDGPAAGPNSGVGVDIDATGGDITIQGLATSITSNSGTVTLDSTNGSIDVDRSVTTAANDGIITMTATGAGESVTIGGDAGQTGAINVSTTNAFIQLNAPSVSILSGGAAGESTTVQANGADGIMDIDATDGDLLITGGSTSNTNILVEAEQTMDIDVNNGDVNIDGNSGGTDGTVSLISGDSMTVDIVGGSFLADGGAAGQNNDVIVNVDGSGPALTINADDSIIFNDNGTSEAFIGDPTVANNPVGGAGESVTVNLTATNDIDLDNGFEVQGLGDINIDGQPLTLGDDPGAGQVITLITESGDVNLTTTEALLLPNITTTSAPTAELNIDVNAPNGGDVDDVGTLNIAGDVDINVEDGSVTLDNTGNNIDGELTITTTAVNDATTGDIVVQYDGATNGTLLLGDLSTANAGGDAGDVILFSSGELDFEGETIDTSTDVAGDQAGAVVLIANGVQLGDIDMSNVDTAAVNPTLPAFVAPLGGSLTQPDFVGPTPLLGNTELQPLYIDFGDLEDPKSLPAGVTINSGGANQQLVNDGDLDYDGMTILSVNTVDVGDIYWDTLQDSGSSININEPLRFVALAGQPLNHFVASDGDINIDATVRPDDSGAFAFNSVYEAEDNIVQNANLQTFSLEADGGFIDWDAGNSISRNDFILTNGGDADFNTNGGSGNIFFNEGYLWTDGGEVTIDANSAGASGSFFAMDFGIRTRGANVTITAEDDVEITGESLVNVNTLDAPGTADILITAQTGDITIAGSQGESITGQIGTTSLSAPVGTITIQSEIRRRGAGVITVDAGVDVVISTLTTANPSGGPSLRTGLLATEDGDLTVTAGDNITVNGRSASMVSATGHILLEAIDNIFVLKNILTTDNGGSITISADLDGDDTFADGRLQIGNPNAQINRVEVVTDTDNTGGAGGGPIVLNGAFVRILGGGELFDPFSNQPLETSTVVRAGGTNGRLTINAASNILVQGGDGPRSTATVSAFEDTLLNAGNDIRISGGTGANADAYVTNESLTPSDLTLQAGGSIAVANSGGRGYLGAVGRIGTNNGGETDVTLLASDDIVIFTDFGLDETEVGSGDIIIRPDNAFTAGSIIPANTLFTGSPDFPAANQVANGGGVVLGQTASGIQIRSGFGDVTIETNPTRQGGASTSVNVGIISFGGAVSIDDGAGGAGPTFLRFNRETSIRDEDALNAASFVARAGDFIRVTSRVVISDGEEGTIDPLFSANGSGVFITETGSINVVNEGNLTIESLGAGGDIRVEGARFSLTSDDGDITVSTTGSGDSNITVTRGIETQAGAVSLVASNEVRLQAIVATTIAGSVETGSGNISLTSSGGDMLLTGAATSLLTQTGSISLTALDGVFVNQAIRVTGLGGTLTILADSDDDGTGDLGISASVRTNDGDINLDVGTATGGGNDLNMNVGGSIASTTGNISLSADDSFNARSLETSGNITIDAGGAVTQLDDSPIVAGGTLTVDTIGNLIFTNGVNSFGAVDITAANANILASGDIELGDINLTGDLTITTNGDITHTGAVFTIGGGDVTLDAGNGSIVLSDPGNVFTGIARLGLQGVNATVDVSNTGAALQLTEVDILNDFLLTTAGSLTQNSSGVVVGDELNINVGGGNNVTLTAAANNIAELFVTANNVTIATSAEIDLHTVTVGNNFTLTTFGNVLQTATGTDFSVGGILDITTNDFDVTLNDPNDVGVVNVLTLDARNILVRLDDVASTSFTASGNVTYELGLGGALFGNPVALTGGSVGGRLQFRASGDIDVTGAVSVVGNATVQALSPDADVQTNTVTGGGNVTSTNGTVVITP